MKDKPKTKDEIFNEHLIKLSNKTFRGYLEELTVLKLENIYLRQQLTAANKGCERLNKKYKRLLGRINEEKSIT